MRRSPWCSTRRKDRRCSASMSRPTSTTLFPVTWCPFGADPFAPARADLKTANWSGAGSDRCRCDHRRVRRPGVSGLQEGAGKSEQADERRTQGEADLPELSAGDRFTNGRCSGPSTSTVLAQQNNETIWKFIATIYDHQGEINEQNAAQSLKDYVKEAGRRSRGGRAPVSPSRKPRSACANHCPGREAERQQHAHVLHQRTQGAEFHQFALRDDKGDGGLRHRPSAPVIGPAYSLL